MGECAEVLEEIVREFEGRGLIVTRRGFIEGISGVKHYFDVIVEDPRTGRKLAFSLTDRIRYEHVLSVLAMRVDAQIPHVVVANEVDPGVEELLRRCNVFTVSFNKPRFSMLSSLPSRDLKEFAKSVAGEILRFLSALGGEG